MPPLVSILIPCHNAAPWLRETLDSALAQTWPRKEVILVDDGSTDASLEIARSYENRGVRVIAQSNKGASAARNEALGLATGDYLQFLDADDLLDFRKIEHQMQLAATAGPASLLCATWSRFSRSIEDADFTPQPLCADKQPVDWVVLNLDNNLMMHPAAWLVSRDLAQKAGPWNEDLSLNDDGEYFNRVIFASQDIRHCSEAISFYRSNLPGSLSKSRTDKAWQSAYRVIELCTSRLISHEDSARTRRACATAFQRFIYESYPAATACRSQAAAHVVRLGGSSLQPDGGPKFRLAQRFLGWRLARRLQNHLG